MFHNQFEAVDNPTPRERIGSGKISPMRTCPCQRTRQRKMIKKVAYPCTGTPRGSEKEDEDGDEGNLSVHSRDVVRNAIAGRIGMSVVKPDGHTNDGNQELAYQHSQGTIHEEGAASKPLHCIEGDGSRADIDERENEGDQEGVTDGAGRLEEGCRIIEDEVDSSPLLHHLK